MEPISNDEFITDFIRFKVELDQLNRGFSMEWHEKWPILHERSSTLPFSKDYIYHIGWASRILANMKPQKHVDISSFHWFSIIMSAFIPVEYYDYRPLPVNLPNLKSSHADITNLPFEDNSVESLSSMSVVEHIGLGRYGDPIDPNGDLKAIAELKRVLALGGYLFFVVPVGKPKILFNAHRIYSYNQILEYFNGLSLVDYALVSGYDSYNGLIYNATEEQTNNENQGAGCFLFRKNHTYSPDQS